MVPSPLIHDLSTAKVWDGTLLKDLVIPFSDIRTRKVPYPFATNEHQNIVGEQTNEWAYSTSSPTLIHQQRLDDEIMNKFTGYIFRDAPPEKLRVINDLTVWFAIYDDVRDDADKFGEENSMERDLLDASVLQYFEWFQNGKSLDEIPDLVLGNVGIKAIVDFMDRFRKNGLSEDQINILVQGFILYAKANKRIDNEELTLEEYVKVRRLAVGVAPYLAFVDWANGFTLTLELRRHPIHQEINTCLTDFFCLSNDVHSLAKEILIESPNENNLVCHLMKRNNSSVQEALFEAQEVSLVALNDLDMTIACIAECELSDVDKALLYRYGDAARALCAGYGQWAYDTARYNYGVARKIVSADTTAIDKYKLRPACQWLREKYILKKLNSENCPDRNPVPRAPVAT